MLVALGVSIQVPVTGYVQFAATLNHEFRVGPHPCFDIILQFKVLRNPHT